MNHDRKDYLRWQKLEQRRKEKRERKMLRQDLPYISIEELAQQATIYGMSIQTVIVDDHLTEVWKPHTPESPQQARERERRRELHIKDRRLMKKVLKHVEAPDAWI